MLRAARSGSSIRTAVKEIDWFRPLHGYDARYLNALETADKDELVPLVELFDSLQRAGFMQALSVAAQVTQEQDELEVVLTAIRDRLAAREEVTSRELEELAVDLRDDAQSLMTEVQDELRSVLKERRIPGSSPAVESNQD